MTPAAYARLIHRALRNPASGIKRAPRSATLPTDAALYYTTAEAAALTHRSRTTLINLLYKNSIRTVTGDHVGNTKSPTTRYWLKEDIHANLTTLTAPETTGTKTRTTPQHNLHTHTTRGKERSLPVGHPGPAYYNTAQTTARLCCRNSHLTYLAKKHNLTVEKRLIFNPRSNQTHIQAFYRKKEIHTLAKTLINNRTGRL
jgi:hypothetical protein